MSSPAPSYSDVPLSWADRCRHFCEPHGWGDDAVAALGLSWGALGEIAADHDRRRDALERAGREVSERLQRIKGVHSVRTRVKDPLHVAEKVARKRRADPARVITLDTYRDAITDLVGVRVLHLDKRAWRQIHDSITAMWTVAEPPTAYVRAGDDAALRSEYAAAGLVVADHPAHYRSVHFLVDHQVGREPGQLVEVQVRTLYEEGWSEVDHRLRYPYGADVLTARLLEHLNRVAGLADDLSTYAAELDDELRTRTAARVQLEDVVDRLQLGVAERDQLRAAMSRAGLPAGPAPRVELHGVLTAGLLTFDRHHGAGSLEGQTPNGETFRIDGIVGEGGASAVHDVVHVGRPPSLHASAGGDHFGRGVIRVGTQTYAGLRFAGMITVAGSGGAEAFGEVMLAGRAQVRLQMFGTYGNPMFEGPSTAQVVIEAEGVALAVVHGSPIPAENFGPESPAAHGAFTVRRVQFVLQPPPPQMAQPTDGSA
jgi:ppGpp synthetase/RelA/SpoT-type nucleotidyltranferase